MKSRSVLIVASATAIAIASGVVVAMMQPSAETPVGTTPAPTPTTPAQPPEVQPMAQESKISSTQTTPPTAAKPQTAIAPEVKTEPTRDVQSCVVKMAIVEDPDAPLNVRSAPTTTAENVVGQVQNGTYLTVAQEQNGWFQITEPMQGWVVKSRTRSGCNEKVERVRFNTGNTSAEISDRFVGTGFHKYLLTAQAGQTITITRQSGPFPSINKPDGKLLAQVDDNRDRWSGELPASGDYTLQFDSNYKGYSYSFVVEIK